MSRRRGLTQEDHELWSRVTRTATPLHKGARHPQPTLPPKPAAPPAIRQPVETSFAPPAGLRIGAASGQGPRGHDFARSPADALAEQSLRMDHKTHKQLRRGKLRPEARLDLHGLTLAQAGPELASFILSCKSRGMRLVLVITGKGRSGDPGPLPTRPGALRHQVPHWLHRPPLSSAVQQVVPAHLRHGGAGAYYVYLRR